MTTMTRGSARYEVHAIVLPIVAKGRSRPSRFAILSAIATLQRVLDADTTQILAQERVGYDEFQVTVLLFWRTDEEVS